MVDVGFIESGRKAKQKTLDIQSKSIISIPTETSNSLSCISMNQYYIYIVGENGTILKYDPETDTFKHHSRSERITTNNLYYIDISVGNGIACGEGFTILNYDLTTDDFSHSSISGYDPNVDIWCACGIYSVYGILNDIYVGRDKTTKHGVIYTWDGTSVTKVLDSPYVDNTGSGILVSLFSIDATRYVAVGRAGQIWKSSDRGNTWTRVETDTDEYFTDVNGIDNTHIWIVSQEGNIYLYNFFTDELKLIKKTGYNLTKIWVIDNNDIYIVGAAGILIHYDGTDWIVIPTGTILAFNSILGLEENKFYIAGSSGYVFRFYNKAYPSLIIDNEGNITGTKAKPLFSVIKGYYPISGDYRPITVNASGELDITLYAETVKAEVSGQPVKISGEAVWVGSGEVTILSGDVRASQLGAWGVQVSGAVQVSGTVSASQTGAWNVGISGSVTVISGQVDAILKKATTMSTTVYTVTAASGGTQIAVTNTNRLSILIQNIGTSDVYIKESGLQSGEGIKIMVNGSYTTDKYVGNLWAIAVVSGDKVVVSEEA